MPPEAVAVNVIGVLMVGADEETVKVVESCEGQFVVQALPKALSMLGAAASLELIDDNLQAASIVAA